MGDTHFTEVNQEGLSVAAELRELHAQLAAKEARIKELEEELDIYKIARKNERERTDTELWKCIDRVKELEAQLHPQKEQQDG